MCKYCDFRNPTPLETRRICCDRVGRKPIVARNDEIYGREGIWLGHVRGNDELGFPEYYEIAFCENGRGFYAEIDYCPKCGRDLRGGSRG